MTDDKPPDAAKCDHKFIDSRHCLKCGWSPSAPQEEAHDVSEDDEWWHKFVHAGDIERDDD